VPEATADGHAQHPGEHRDAHAADDRDGGRHLVDEGGDVDAQRVRHQ